MKKIVKEYRENVCRLLDKTLITIITDKYEKREKTIKFLKSRGYDVEAVEGDNQGYSLNPDVNSKRILEHTILYLKGRY